MKDAFHKALAKDANIVLAVAITTETCRTAQSLQELESTSAIALGRLLTAAALTGLVQPRTGDTSLQVVASGRLGQVFADVTQTGNLRGYVRNTQLDLPVCAPEESTGRRSIADGMGEGQLSVIRMNESNQFTQSKTALQTGEIDADIAYFLEQSEQIPTVMCCDVLLNDHGKVIKAAGLIAHGMPNASQTEMEKIRKSLEGQTFATMLRENSDNWQNLIQSLIPSALPIGDVIPLQWQCRCSQKRVLSALKMLEVTDLADMVQNQQSAEVQCDFCLKNYVVSPNDVTRIYESTIVAQG